MSYNLQASGGTLGALPARFRRPRLLIVGCGDVGLRVVRALSLPESTKFEPDQIRPGGSPQAFQTSQTPRTPHSLQTRHMPRVAAPRLTVRALTSSPGRVAALRARGVTPLTGDLDAPATLRRLAGLATHVLHLAPPPAPSAPPAQPASSVPSGPTRPAGPSGDPRTAHLLQALRRGGAPVLIYGSTTGVYGDCGGRWIDETAPAQARTARARRRADAEQRVRLYARGSGARAAILRIPGIYAPDRDGGTPQARLRKGTPALAAADDVYTSHIHADDLARALVAALWRGAPRRIYNACDDTVMKMGDYFDFAADLHGLPRPPRITRAEAARTLPPLLLSFMSESRRLRNDRLKRELGLRLRYPTVAQGLGR